MNVNAPLEEIYRIAGKAAWDAIDDQTARRTTPPRCVPPAGSTEDLRKIGKAVIDAINPTLSEYLGAVLGEAFGQVWIALGRGQE